jgi:hypothetical protein
MVLERLRLSSRHKSAKMAIRTDLPYRASVRKHWVGRFDKDPLVGERKLKRAFQEVKKA